MSRIHDISILMPVYRPNLEWLEAAIEGIKNQTYTSWCLIACLDGNDEKTMAAIGLLRKIVDETSRLIILRGQHGGITKALNRGLQVCESEFIARHDCDDISYPKRFEEQIGCLKSSESIIACGSQLTPIDFNGQEIVNYKYRYPRSSLSVLITGAYFNTPVAHPSLMVKTSALKSVDGYKEANCMEDYMLLSELIEMGDIVNLAYPLVKYRQHSHQVTKATRPSRKDLFEARRNFEKKLCTKKTLFNVLRIIPLILFVIGPKGESNARRLCRKLISRFEKMTRHIATIKEDSSSTRKQEG